MMATVRPISPQYQHTLDSAISLAKELASKNMADSSETSPKTPNSPKRFNFKLKHFSKSFTEASANIRDIESSISHKAKEAYESLIENGPYNSYSSGYPSSYIDHPHHHHHHHHHHHNTFHRHHTHTIGPQHHHAFSSDDFSPSFQTSTKLKHASTFSVKRAFF